MSKKRVYEIAKELHVDNKKVIDTLHDMGVGVNNHMAGVDDEVYGKLTSKLSGAKPSQPAAPKQEQPAAPSQEQPKAESAQPKEGAPAPRPQGEEAKKGNVTVYRPNQHGAGGSQQGGRPPRREGDRPQGDRPGYQGSRPQGDRPGYQGSRPQGDRPGYQGSRPQGDRPQGDRPQGDRPQGDRPGYQGSRPPGDRPGYQGNRPQGDRPGYQGSRPQGDRPQGDRPGYQGNRPPGDRPGYQGNRPPGDRPGYQGNRPPGDRPGYQGNRPPGDRPGYQGNRPPGDRPGYQGNRPPGDRPGYQGSRPQGDRPGYQGNRPQGDRPQGGYGGGNRPQGGGQRGGGRPDKLAIPEAPNLDTKISRQQRPDLKKDENFKREKSYDGKPKKGVKKSHGIDYDKPLTALVNDLVMDENGEWVLETAENIKATRRAKKDKDTHSASGKGVKIEAIAIPDKVMVSDLASLISKNPNEIIVKLMQLGTMATINQEIDYDIAELIASDFGISVQLDIPKEVQEQIDLDQPDNDDDMETRAPIVTVMGHVDHGKTSLLDAIRKTNVIGGEAGGITQHIGASEVFIKDRKIVFLDTPGHEAFTSLRARGAKITDIAILVVAADDGVMPQTIEAIDHAKAAGVPIIVAINKIDKEGANQEKVVKELADAGVLLEDWGGDVVSVPVSAKQSLNIDTLLEMVLLVADMQNLKANPNRPARGTIIEARLEKGRGPIATVLVDSGTLNVGDPVVAGFASGRVRAMFNYSHKKIKTVGPSTCVEITGLDDVPQAGDRFYVTRDDKQAKDMASRKKIQTREDGLRQTKHISLEDLFSHIKEGTIKELNIIIKADVHGSIEAMKGSLSKLNNEEVRVNVIHASIGTITESDVMLASASNAIIIGFNVRPMSNVERMAEQESVEIKTYRIIYEAINDVEAAMKGMLDPIYKEVVLGKIQVRETFKVPKIGLIAGAYVTDGKVTRSANVRVVREGIVIHDGKISSLKRFKDDVKEVAAGFECGIGIEKFNDLKVDDEIEAYIIEEVKRV